MPVAIDWSGQKRACAGQTDVVHVLQRIRYAGTRLIAHLLIYIDIWRENVIARSEIT